MLLNQEKFAISPTISLMNELGGAFHTTSCRNFNSIVDKGILPGSNLNGEYASRYASGRVRSYYGVFAPWDNRNIATKTRVTGRGQHAMPMTVMYIPSTELLRQD